MALRYTPAHNRRQRRRDRVGVWGTDRHQRRGGVAVHCASTCSDGGRIGGDSPCFGAWLVRGRPHRGLLAPLPAARHLWTTRPALAAPVPLPGLDALTVTGQSCAVTERDRMPKPWQGLPA